MPKKKVEVYEKDQLIYPFIENDHVTFSNGMKINEMLNQSISMPTVIHEDLSFKVGVGDQDASNAIVDSSVAKMTIKGKTYQNILPEPSTHVLTNNKEMFKVNEGLDHNVEIVDGVSKSAILKGQTLVNIKGEITSLTSNVPTKYRREYLIPTVKKNKDYYIKYEAECDNPDAVFAIGFLQDTSRWSNRLEAQPIKGSFILNSGDNPNYFRFIGKSTESTNGITDLKLLVIEYQDGMENWDIPYFEGMQSVNLYPDQKVSKITWKSGQYYNKNGELTTANANANHRYFDEYVEIHPNHVYTISGNNNYKNLNFYDANKNYVLKVSGTSLWGDGSVKDDLYATAPTNAKYMRYNMAIGSNMDEGTTIFDTTLGIPLMKTSITETYFHKMPVLTTTGKNLWNEDLLKTKPYIDSLGRYGEFEIVNLDKDKQYTITLSCITSSWANMTIYYTNGETTQHSVGNKESYSFTTIGSPYKVEKIRFYGSSESYAYDIQIEEGSTATPYEPYKSNILTTNEEVTLRGIGDVKDELDCLTGEVIERIKEDILNGSEKWMLSSDENDTTIRFALALPLSKPTSIVCEQFKVEHTYGKEYECIQLTDNKTLVIRISKTKATDLVTFKAWLSQNPIKIQYPLATPVIKTVDLLSSGNWEKVVLDGSENWRWDFNDNQYFQTYIPRGEGNKFNNSVPDRDGGSSFHDANPNHYTSFAVGNNYGFTVKIVKSEFSHDLSSSSGDVNLNVWKQYLSQNPITVWYQTATHLDSTQVKQPIFFKDGHIIQSSGVDNSLIPTLDYQAKTSNSYVMDLMKTNTKYTMKAKSASGTFTIDGTSYGAGTNGIFTTPSSMTNKLLVMSNKTNEEVMILEGDVIDKTIPYIKGIKSAFEGESKIEVLSTGKNLFDAYKHKFDTSSSPGLRVEVLSSNSIRTYCTDTIAWRSASVVYQLEPHTWYNIRCEVTGNGTKQLDINIPEYGTSWNPNTVNCTQSNNMLGKFLTDESGKVKLSFQGSGSESISYDNTYTNIQIEKIQEKSTIHSFYEPYKSNSTKIPLSSPLRSLPNGVCDEIILDRENNKAKIIQRVGKATVLETPVITEVDLEGFPYIYKNGYIFLNSEIAPTTEITYSINQCQQISASNEDIIRHEKELTYLQKLIAQYVQVDYESVLLSLKV